MAQPAQRLVFLAGNATGDSAAADADQPKEGIIGAHDAGFAAPGSSREGHEDGEIFLTLSEHPRCVGSLDLSGQVG